MTHTETEVQARAEWGGSRQRTWSEQRPGRGMERSGQRGEVWGGEK